jgi:hypothetical protein
LLQEFEDYHPQIIQNLLPNRKILERKKKTNIGLNFDTLWEQNQLINDEVKIS